MPSIRPSCLQRCNSSAVSSSCLRSTTSRTGFAVPSCRCAWATMAVSKATSLSPARQPASPPVGARPPGARVRRTWRSPLLSGGDRRQGRSRRIDDGGGLRRVRGTAGAGGAGSAGGAMAVAGRRRQGQRHDGRVVSEHGRQHRQAQRASGPVPPARAPAPGRLGHGRGDAVLELRQDAHAFDARASRAGLVQQVGTARLAIPGFQYRQNITSAVE